MRTIRIASGLVLFWIFSGCAPLRVHSSQATDQQTQTVLTLDDAIQALDRPSANTRSILERVSDKLASQGRDALRHDVLNFLARMPPERDEFPCGTDFLRSRASRELYRLIDQLLAGTPPPVEPAVCFSVPAMVEAAGDDRRNGTLEVYGYDFDRVAPELVLIHNGSFADVSAALTPRSHFHLTVRTGRDAVKLSGDSETLGLAWGNVLHYTIPIVQETTALCEVKTENIAAGKVVRFSPPRIGAVVAQIREKRKVRANVVLETVVNALEVRLCATIEEGRAPPVFSGCGSEQIFTSGSDRQIDRIVGSTESAFSSERVGRSASIQGDSSGPVAAWELSETGSMPEVAVTLNELRVVSVPADRCISPFKYNEAKQRNQLSQDTVRRLDAQLATPPERR